tara:strand:+ start:108 stop:1037 length:930 start_codon:yes stop_codon:yes gene_type:complete
MRYLNKINNTLKKLMKENKNLYILGEDILDPYGGAFKVTKEISSLYPSRVITTPVSEAAITGIACGMSMNGKKVILEIMFGDFLSLTFDQVLNHISKFQWLFNEINMPLIIRTPMGGYRGYGATHSQSIEKHFCGIPNLNVIAIDRYCDIENIYLKSLKSNKPTLIIENKILYSKEQLQTKDLPIFQNPDVICVGYGGVVDFCVESSKELLEEEEINVSVYNLNNLNPFQSSKIKDLSRLSKKFVFVEEACGEWGFSEMCKSSLTGINDIKTISIKGPSHPLPSSKNWELELLPNKNKIKKAIIELYKI